MVKSSCNAEFDLVSLEKNPLEKEGNHSKTCLESHGQNLVVSQSHGAIRLVTVTFSGNWSAQ